MHGSGHDFTKSCTIEVDGAWLGSCFYIYHRGWPMGWSCIFTCTNEYEGPGSWVMFSHMYLKVGQSPVPRSCVYMYDDVGQLAQLDHSIMCGFLNAIKVFS